jgi:signal transduction histidine kinase
MLILAISIILVIVLYNKRVLQQKHQIQETKFKHQKELIEATIQVEENEREKIAKNIHDDLGALLNVIRLNNVNAIKKVTDSTVVLKSLENNKELLNSTSEIIRSVARQLAPPTLIKLGYVEGVRELCKHVNNTEVVSMNFEPKGITNRFEQKIEVQLYRVTQEVVNNILKHADSSLIELNLSLVDRVLILTITHNGKGIDKTEIDDLMNESKGLGLKSIQTRIHAINGEIEYLTNTQNDSKVTIHIPISDEKN